MAKQNKLHLSSSSSLVLRTLAKLVKSARLERGMSQKELADRVGISRHTLMAIEKGDHKVAIGAVLEACIIVGIPLLAENETELIKLNKTLSNIAILLPTRGQGKKVELDDNF